MDLYTLAGNTEKNDAYQRLAASNSARQYSFLSSMVTAALEVRRPLLSDSIIRAFNYHAIVGLHHKAGQYRSHDISVGQGRFTPPAHFHVAPLMDDLVNIINWMWQSAKPIELAAEALWRINYIHPFVNGNGRAARATCYFILCVKFKKLLPGRTILPERLRYPPVRQRYLDTLQAADRQDIAPLVDLLTEQLRHQILDLSP